MPGRIVYGIMAVLGLSLISMQPQVHIDTGPSELGSETPGMTGNRSMMASHNMVSGEWEAELKGPRRPPPPDHPTIRAQEDAVYPRNAANSRSPWTH